MDRLGRRTSFADLGHRLAQPIDGLTRIRADVALAAGVCREFLEIGGATTEDVHGVERRGIDRAQLQLGIS